MESRVVTVQACAGSGSGSGWGAQPRVVVEAWVGAACASLIAAWTGLDWTGLVGPVE